MGSLPGSNAWPGIIAEFCQKEYEMLSTLPERILQACPDISPLIEQNRRRSRYAEDFEIEGTAKMA